MTPILDVVPGPSLNVQSPDHALGWFFLRYSNTKAADTIPNTSSVRP
jgi:hypothetical protein